MTVVDSVSVTVSVSLTVIESLIEFEALIDAEFDKLTESVSLSLSVLESVSPSVSLAIAGQSSSSSWLSPSSMQGVAHAEVPAATPTKVMANKCERLGVRYGIAPL
ncbi:MAG: hypothetical protein IAG13_13775 [Deltaproteobacteria bacterium]|nr:hypothetical protein [Nannocystaceae bacterium]